MTHDVAIVGAGPYGLSAASHLKAVRGLRVQVFGQPMSFWSQHMPAGMCLRFPLEGSSLSDPGNHGRLSLSEYLRSMRGPVESAIFASDDLFPGLCEIPLLAYTIGARALGRTLTRNAPPATNTIATRCPDDLGTL